MSIAQADGLFFNKLRGAVADQLPSYLQEQRWFRAKARDIQAVALKDCLIVTLAGARALIVLAKVEYSEGHDETYVVPLLQLAEAPAVGTEPTRSVLHFQVSEASKETVLTDALASPEFLAALLAAIQDNRSFTGESGTLLARKSSALDSLLPKTGSPPAGSVLKAEQSNTSILYGDRAILKFYRCVEEGVNPDLEVGQFLTEIAHFPNTPQLGGSLEYQTNEGRAMTLGILQAFVANQGDAWNSTLRSLKELLTQALADSGLADSSKRRPGSKLKTEHLPAAASEQLAAITRLMGLLGKRTAEMHLAMANGKSNPAFLPEPFTPAYREFLGSALHDLTIRNFDLLRSKMELFSETTKQAALRAAKCEEEVLLTFHTLLENDIAGLRIRIHGDYHLGQVLFTGSDFMIIDFEGEPARPIEERRAKRSPLQDVAGMLRSFHYAERSALLAFTEGANHSSDELSQIVDLLSLWRSIASGKFLDEYRTTVKGAPFLPKKWEESEALLRVHLLEKAVYEMGYELNNRPSWLPIPLRGIEDLVGKTAHKTA